MMNRFTHSLTLTALLACSAGLAPAAYLSPDCVAASPDGSRLYVTAATAPKLLVYDTAANRVTDEWPLGQRPTGVAVAPNGTLLVAAGGSAGTLSFLKPDGSVIGRIAAGHTPMCPLVSPDGKTAYLLNRFSDTVLFIDTATLKVTSTLKAVREPCSAALGAGGKLLFVANLLPYVRATNDLVAAAVTLIDTSSRKVLRNILLPNGATGVRGCAASPDGKFVYVVHTFARYQLPTTQLERGWMNTAGLSIFNGETGDFVNTVLLDDVDLGAANPWGVTVTPDNQWVIVSHAGTREISIIDRAKLHDRLDRAARNEKVTEVTKSANDVPNDLSFLVGIRRRVKLNADGPHGVAVAKDDAYVACYYSEAIVRAPLAEHLGAPAAELAAVGPNGDCSKDPVRRGEMLFNDGAMCFQQWQSCASCHPDARIDALNWDLLNDGIGNPKQSKSMLFSHLTPPVMSTGIRPNLQACVRKGILFIQFVVRPETDALCIDQYLMSLKPVPSPYLVNGKLSPAALRGQELFERAGCADCHSTELKDPDDIPLYTDLQLHKLLGSGSESEVKFDTPTLREVWRTAPWLYDGRALTMEELLTTANHDDIHGMTSTLKPEEIHDLAEFILSL